MRNYDEHVDRVLGETRSRACVSAPGLPHYMPTTRFGLPHYVVEEEDMDEEIDVAGAGGETAEMKAERGTWHFRINSFILRIVPSSVRRCSVR